MAISTNIHKLMSIRQQHVGITQQQHHYEQQMKQE